MPISVQPQVLLASFPRIQGADREFCLPNCWSLLVFLYEMDAAFDGRHHHVMPGHVVIVPPGGHKRYHQRGLDLRHIVFHLTFPESPTAALVAVPELIDLAEKLPYMTERLLQAVAWFVTDRQRCAVRVWDFLNELADVTSATEAQVAQLHPVVRRAQGLMEQDLGIGLTIAAIAQRVGCSPGYLSTIFSRQCGCGPAQWLRARRMTRAEHLLKHSNRTIQSIAAEVGIPDLQHFNKTVRRHFGMSPRQVRTHTKTIHHA